MKMKRLFRAFTYQTAIAVEFSPLSTHCHRHEKMANLLDVAPLSPRR